MQNAVNATVYIFNNCDDFRVRLSSQDMLAFADATAHSWPDKKLHALIATINAVIPKFSAQPCDPEGGVARHHFEIGREHAYAVLHVQVSTHGLSVNELTTLEMALNGVAREYKVDDAELLNPGQAQWDFRYWWN